MDLVMTGAFRSEEEADTVLRGLELALESMGLKVEESHVETLSESAEDEAPPFEGFRPGAPGAIPQADGFEESGEIDVLLGAQEKAYLNATPGRDEDRGYIVHGIPSGQVADAQGVQDSAESAAAAMEAERRSVLGMARLFMEAPTRPSRFASRAIIGEDIGTVDGIRDIFAALDETLQYVLPEGRYKSLARTNLEVAGMFATKAISHADEENS